MKEKNKLRLFALIIVVAFVSAGYLMLKYGTPTEIDLSIFQPYIH